MSRLIVNVDDFGANTKVDNRILQAFAAKKISSTSVFANMQWSRSSHEGVRSSGIPTGVHLNLTSGKAVLPRQEVTSLVDGANSFLSSNKNMDLNHICALELKKEFNAQIKAYRRKGFKVRFLDCHRAEIHFNKQLFKVCIELASEYKVRIRNPLSALTRRYLKEASKAYGVDVLQLEHLAEYYKSICSDLRVEYTENFINDSSSVHFRDYFERCLSETPEKGSIELCIHFNGDLGREKFEWIMEKDLLKGFST